MVYDSGGTHWFSSHFLFYPYKKSNSYEVKVCMALWHCCLKPNTHRRRDETVESRRVCGVYTNSQLVGDSFVVSSVWTHPSAVVTHTAVLCVRIAESVGSRREFMYTPPTPTRRDSTVSSRRRRRCVLVFNVFICYFVLWATCCNNFQTNENQLVTLYCFSLWQQVISLSMYIFVWLVLLVFTLL